MEPNNTFANDAQNLASGQDAHAGSASASDSHGSPFYQAHQTATCAITDGIYMVEGEPVSGDRIREALSHLRKLEATDARNLVPSKAALLAILFPGLGALYNGTYVRAAYQLLTFALLTSLASYHGTFALLAVGLYAFTIVDAYRMARKLSLGLIVQEDSALETIRRHAWIPAGILMLLGVAFFLNNLEAIDLDKWMDVGWPLILVAFGIGLLIHWGIGQAAKKEEGR